MRCHVSANESYPEFSVGVFGTCTTPIAGRHGLQHFHRSQETPGSPHPLYQRSAGSQSGGDGKRFSYVERDELEKSRVLLKQLGVEIPALPPYDLLKDEMLPWEDEVAAMIKKAKTASEPKTRTKLTRKLPPFRKGKK